MSSDSASLNYHQLPVKKVLDILNTNATEGLHSEQVRERLEKYGKNVLRAPLKKSLISLVLEQFSDHLVQILLAAAVISFAFVCMEKDFAKLCLLDFAEPFVILLILIINSLVGISQESNADKALAALKQFSPEFSTVVRNSGICCKVCTADLVPGDIVELRMGDKVSADGRVIGILTASFKMDESMLTGESNPVSKQVDAVCTEDAFQSAQRLEILQRMPNMVFAGTLCTVGKAQFVVTATGMQTYLGSIHSSLQQTVQETSPLKEKLDEFGDNLAKVISVICILVWLANMPHFGDSVHGGVLKGALHYFKVAIALAVAAIPEGLAVIITTCLALGTMRMAKKNAIVRKLSSVETLGCTTVICSDKTGTITSNKMSVCKFASFAESSAEMAELIIEGTGYNPFGLVQHYHSTQPAETVSRTASVWWSSVVCSLCNLSKVQYAHSVENSKESKFITIGEPTEIALRVFVERLESNNLDFNKKLKGMGMSERTTAVNLFIQEQFSVKAILEFTRERKAMSVVAESVESHEQFLFVKGAPEELILKSTHFMLSDGSVEKLTEGKRKMIFSKVSEYSTASVLRVLAVCMKRNPPTNDILNSLDNFSLYQSFEDDLTFLGIVGMHDAPRSEVKESIKKCQDAGIKVIVVTGDSKETTEAVCRDVGLFLSNESVDDVSFTGRYFDSLSSTEKSQIVKKAKAFSRVEPRHKSEIVSILREQREIVAMTGDGINDAPALKLAHIGIGMGSGTDVAKLASDIILADDNFSTLVFAVQEGRAIYANTKQFIRYLISSNIGEVACIFLAAILGLPEILTPVQLLWVNLVTDGLPATALGFNPTDSRIMKEPPRDAKAPIVNRWQFIRYLIIGSWVGIATVAGYMTYHSESTIKASTISLSILVLIEMFNALNALSETQSLFQLTPLSNPLLILAVLGSLILHAFVLYVPMLQRIMNVTALCWSDWKLVFCLSIPVIFIDECAKYISRKQTSRSSIKEKKQQ